MDEHDYLYGGFRNLRRELRRAISGISDDYEALKEGGPNLRQTLRHMLDTAARVDYPRLEQIAAGNHAHFPDLGEERDLSVRFDPEESAEEMVAALGGLCEECCDWLEPRSEEEWQRAGTHAILGVHPLAWWADRMLAHLERHLAYIRGD